MANDPYTIALDSYLSREGVTERAVAALAEITQASINRYRNGRRLPSADIAKRIERASEGAVPFSTWQKTMAEKLGLAA